LAIWFFFNCSVFYAFGGMWGGPYLIEIYKLDKAQTGQILSMIALGMIVGAPLLSFSSNRVFHGRKPVLILSSSMLVCITAFLTFYTDRFSVTSLYVMCLFLGICAQGIVAIVFITTKELFPVQIAGTASGLVNLFPFIGAGVFQPFLGYLMEREGKVEGAFTPAAYSHAFFVLFLCGMIAFVASLFLRETMARE
jgi:sugar phosphate permease